MSAGLSYLYCNQSCTVEEVFPTVGHICPLSLSLGLLPPDITHTVKKIKPVSRSMSQMDQTPESFIPQICVVYGQVVGVGQCQGGFGQVSFLLSVHWCGEGRFLRDGCSDGGLKHISYSYSRNQKGQIILIILTENGGS